MKKCLLFFVASLVLLAGKLDAADTLKIHLTYKHKLTPKGQTTGYNTIKQQFYTWEGVFFREINYDEKTAQISDYIFRFYRNGKLFTEECYKANDSLAYIIKHDYDQNNNETVITKLVPSEKGLVQIEKTVMTFDNNHKTVSTKKYFGKKPGITTRYTYDPSGLLINEASSYKTIANAEKKQETKSYSHSNGRIDKVSVKGKDADGKVFSYIENYSYNEKGLLVSVKKTDAEGQLMEEKIYKYLPSGAPSLYEEHDAAGRLVNLLQYDYKKHFMEIGTQESMYENLRN